MANEFAGPVLNKVRGGIGRRAASDDGVAALIMGGVSVAGTMTLGTVYQINDLSDAEALGITASYDANNKVLAWYHIKSFFTYAPNGTLFISVVAQGTSMASMCDTSLSNLKALITSPVAARRIKFCGVVLNPTTAYAATFSNGFDADVLAAIPKAQELATTFRNSAIYIDNILIEGRMQSAVAISTLKDCSTYSSENVSVLSGQDPTIVALDTNYARTAAVGAALGMLACRKVSECIGSVDIANKPDTAKGLDTFPLTNLAAGYFLDASLSNGRSYNSLTEAEKVLLSSKRIIYVGAFEGLDGYYLSDSHTCITTTDDYAYMEDNRVWNKAAQLIRRALLPLMKSEIQVDATSGNLSISQVAYYQSIAKKALKDMARNSEISGEPSIIIDPAQNVLTTGGVSLGINYVRNGILRSLTGNIAAINPSSN